MLQVHANGLEFHCLTKGSGPKVLLLHGFPDTAHTWQHQMDALAHAGFCAIAPYLRGYHPAIVAAHLLDPKHVQRSFHWWFFQQADFPEKALLADDMAFIDYLWREWCAPGYEDREHIQSVKDCLRQAGVLQATLGYYRAMFDPAKADPALAALRNQMARPITVPTLALCGAQDLRAELMRQQDAYFTGGYTYLEVLGAGHFLHREQPAAVNQLLLDWLR